MTKKVLIATMSLVMGSVLIAAFPKMATNSGKSTDTIQLSQCIPLADVAEIHVDNDGYYHVTLKDIGNQLDDPENISYSQLFENLEMMEGK